MPDYSKIRSGVHGIARGEQEFTDNKLKRIQGRLHASLPDWLYVPLRNVIWRKVIFTAAKIVDSLNELRGLDFSNAPPWHVCLEYGMFNRQAYLASGQPLAAMLRYHMRAARIELPPDARILDFGCSAGRVLESFCSGDGDNFAVFGCDINPRPIAWIKKNRQLWTVAVNECWPPLPILFREMDFVYAISVFTHMSQEHAEAWARHLHAIIKPGGWLLATFIDPSHDWAIKQFQVRAATVQETGFYYKEARNITFLTRDYLTSRWGDLFVLIDYGPAHGYRQNMAVFRRL